MKNSNQNSLLKKGIVLAAIVILSVGAGIFIGSRGSQKGGAVSSVSSDTGSSDTQTKKQDQKGADPSSESVSGVFSVSDAASSSESIPDAIRINGDHFDADEKQMIGYLRKVLPNITIEETGQNLASDGHSIPAYSMAHADHTKTTLGLKISEDGRVEGILITGDEDAGVLVDVVTIAHQLDESVNSAKATGKLYKGDQVESDHLTVSFGGSSDGSYVGAIVPKE